MLQSSSDKQIAQMATMLISMCIYSQNNPAKALQMVSEYTESKNLLPEELIYIGDLYAENGQWHEAVKAWLSVQNKQRSRNGLCSRITDNLLRAAVYFSKTEKWGDCLECILKAKNNEPKNIALNKIPTQLEADMPIISHCQGNYIDAISYWEKDLKNNGYQPRIIHMLAISTLSAVEEEAALPEAKLKNLVKSHMYWCVLKNDQNYWKNYYKDRKIVYNGKISEKEFISTACEAGVNKCEVRLEELRQSGILKKYETDANFLKDKRQQMKLEKFSSSLLSQIKSNQTADWPPGGYGFLQFIWGDKGNTYFEQAIAGIESDEINSIGWKLKGLRNDETRQAFFHYLSGNLGACINYGKTSKDASLINLAGVACIDMAEISINAQNITGCRQMAAVATRIPDTILKNRAIELLEKITENKLKQLIRQRLKDEAIVFADEILKYIPFKGIKENLCSLLLSRSEEKYLRDDLTGFFKDYDKAAKYTSSNEVCERHLKKIIRYHLNKLFKNKKWKAINTFLTDTSRRYSQAAFIQAQKHFFKALETIEQSSIDNPKVLKELESAHRKDPENAEISEAYSVALSSRAVSNFNNLSSYNAISTIKESKDMLLKALTVNPNNQQAKTNLIQLAEISVKAGLNIF